MTHPEPHLSVHLFGIPEVTAQPDPVVIARGQVRALLYRLAAADEPLSRDYLAFLFWPDVDDSTARQNLSVALSHLRRALPDGGILNAKKDAISLAADSIWSDVKTFVSVCLSEESRSRQLKEAVTLYRGTFLDGVFLNNCPEFETWQIAERQRYEQIYLNTLKRLIAEATAYGDYAEAISYAQRYLESDPAEEEIHRRLMELFLASGDRSAALQQYETCVATLERELGVPPMDETRAIYEAALEKRRSNLPVPPTRLIGREAEMALTTRLLRQDDIWLVTLNGPGGSGKTRLALEAATQVQAHFLHGVYFVDLAPVQDHRQVARTIFQTVGLEDKPGVDHLQVLSLFLRERRILLVLDNFEQVVDAARDLVTLHSHAPGLKLLVTSRVSLHVRGEREAPVPPLALPPEVDHANVEQLKSSAAVQLFSERVQAVRPSFILDDLSADIAARICIALDGLPLAIELAAARCKLFTPQALYERLSDPLNLLSHGAHDLPKRQQTLRATMIWSVGLLTPDEQKLFRRLGVFRGSFTFDSAESVCSIDGDLSLDILDGIEALLDHNLVRPVQQADAEAPRFTMLETIRSFALEQAEAAQELSNIQHRYASYFMHLAEEAQPHLTGFDQIEWLKRLDVDRVNFRQALDWMLQAANAEMACRSCAALGRYWLYKRIADGSGYPEKALQIEPANLGSISRAQTIVYYFEFFTISRAPGDLPEITRSYLEEALVIFRAHGDLSGEIDALLGLVNVPIAHGDFAEAKRLIDQAEDAAQRSEDPLLRAQALGFSVPFWAMQGEFEKLIELSTKKLTLLQQLAGPLECLRAREVLLESAYYAMDLASSRAYSEEIIQTLDLLDPTTKSASLLETRGKIEWLEGNHQKAREFLEQADRLHESLTGQRNANHLLYQGVVAQSLREYDTAIAFYVSSLALWRESGWHLAIAETLTYLSDATYYVGRLAEALAYLQECLAIYWAMLEAGSAFHPYTPLALAVAAKIEENRGNLSNSLKLHSAAENLYGPVRKPEMPLPLPHIEDYQQRMDAVRAQLDEATYAQTWDEGAAMSMHDALVFALSLYET